MKITASWKQALENAIPWLEADVDNATGIYSILKQCAHDEDVEYGDEMGAFVDWAMIQLTGD